MKMQKVLVVDDQEANLEFLDHQLKRAGWQVILASNGKEALEKTEMHRPHVIVLDIVMPDMDGFQVARFIKENPDYQNIRIIAATSLTSAADRHRCFAAGCDDYIAKPFTVQQLQQRLALLLVSNSSTPWTQRRT